MSLVEKDLFTEQLKAISADFVGSKNKEMILKILFFHFQFWILCFSEP